MTTEKKEDEKVSPERERAETRKANAEAARIEQELAIDQKKADAEIKKLEAEADEATAAAEKARIDANILGIAFAREQRFEDELLADNKYHHTYHFTTSVNSQSVKALMDQLNVWVRNANGKDGTRKVLNIEIAFTSPGGSIIDGMALYDYIQRVRRDGHHVITSTLGMAASMAGILLQAGDERVMAKESWLMIHEAAFGAMGKIGEIEDTVEWVKKIQERILEIFASRSKLTKKQLATNWRRKDWWISSDEALKLGLVDRVE